MVIPSAPGLPWFVRTRFHALWRFSPSHTSSISCSVTAGLSGAGFATDGSALGFRRPRLHPGPDQLDPGTCGRLNALLADDGEGTAFSALQPIQGGLVWR